MQAPRNSLPLEAKASHFHIRKIQINDRRVLIPEFVQTRPDNADLHKPCYNNQNKANHCPGNLRFLTSDRMKPKKRNSSQYRVRHIQKHDRRKKPPTAIPRNRFFRYLRRLQKRIAEENFIAKTAFDRLILYFFSAKRTFFHNTIFPHSSDGIEKLYFFVGNLPRSTSCLNRAIPFFIREPTSTYCLANFG